MAVLKGAFYSLVLPTVLWAFGHNISIYRIQVPLPEHANHAGCLNNLILSGFCPFIRFPISNFHKSGANTMKISSPIKTLHPIKFNPLRIPVIMLLITLFLFSSAYAFPFGGPKPKRGGSMYGFVITRSGINEPGLQYAHLEGVSVEVKGAGGTFTTLTDSKGSFQFDVLPPGDYTVSFSKKGFGVFVKQVKILDARVENLGNITLVPDGGVSTEGIILPDTAFIAMASAKDADPGINTRFGELNKWMHGGPDEHEAPAPDDKLNPISTYENCLMLISPEDTGKTTYIKLEHSPLWLCFNISGTTLYVADMESTIWIYDILRNNLKLGYIPLSSSVNHMKLSPDGRWLFAVCTTDITIIDTRQNIVVNTIPLPIMSDGTSGTPWASTCSPDGNILYVAMGSENNGEVIAVDASTKQPVARAMTGSTPTGIAVTPDGSKLFTANLTSGSVSVLSTNPLKLISTVPVGVGPGRVVVSPDGEKVFVTCRESSTLVVLAAGTGEKVASIPVGKQPMDLAITGDGTKVYVTNTGDGTISVIDAKKNVELNRTQPQRLCRPCGVVVKP